MHGMAWALLRTLRAFLRSMHAAHLCMLPMLCALHTLRRYVLANIHDHLTSWKLDLDVAGRNNAFAVSVSLTGA